jgi:hypothetical protein
MTALTLVDEMLKVMLEDGVPSLGTPGMIGPSQVFFDPPETTAGTTVPPRLCIYLVDVRENVHLRSLERQQLTAGGTVKTRRPPYRLDCHYLISAFAGTNLGDPPLLHDMLYETTETLIRAQPLVPARALAGHGELAKWPADQRDVELPLTVNPPEGFPKLAEFWGTMPNRHPWRPVVHAIVTIPIELVASAAIGVVHQPITVYTAGAYAHIAGSGPSEGLSQVGGTVVDKNGTPVGRARVFVADAGGQVLARTTCADDGRFIIKLPAGTDRIYAAAFGFGITPPLTLPLTSAALADEREYNLRFP